MIGNLYGVAIWAYVLLATAYSMVTGDQTVMTLTDMLLLTGLGIVLIKQQ